MSHVNLYNDWAKFKRRTAEERLIFKTAGIHNCWQLDDHGKIVECLTAVFLEEERYCLKGSYKIPKVIPVGDFTYVRYYYKCPHCLRYHGCSVDPSELSGGMRAVERCTLCKNEFELAGGWS